MVTGCGGQVVFDALFAGIPVFRWYGDHRVEEDTMGGVGKILKIDEQGAIVTNPFFFADFPHTMPVLKVAVKVAVLALFDVVRCCKDGGEGRALLLSMFENQG